MSECKYKGENRKCYYPGLIDPDLGPDWCVEGPCHLIEPIKEKKAGCPMTKDVPLTSGEIKRFCEKGCSVACDDLLQDYLKKIGRSMKPIEAANGEPIDYGGDLISFSR